MAKNNTNYWTNKANSYTSFNKSKAYKKLSTADMNSAYKDYSSLVNGGFSAYAQANGLEDYTSRLQSMLMDIQSSKFNYNPEGDGAYQAYKNQYEGRAILDQANAQAQANGGSGFLATSYGQQAGNAAYQNQLSNLSQVQSDLLNMAYNKYANNLNNKQSMFSNINQIQNNNYNQYRDAISNAYTNLAYQTDKYNTAYTNAYNKWNADRNYAQSNMQYYGNLQQSYNSLAAQKSIADKNYKLQKQIAKGTL